MHRLGAHLVRGQPLELSAMRISPHMQIQIQIQIIDLVTLILLQPPPLSLSLSLALGVAQWASGQIRGLPTGEEASGQATGGRARPL